MQDPDRNISYYFISRIVVMFPDTLIKAFSLSQQTGTQQILT